VVSINNGSGSFPSSITPDPNFSPQNLGFALGDYDNDGDLDLAITSLNEINGAYYARVYRNNGNGTFDPNGIYIHPGWGVGSWYQRSWLAWGDCNNDGWLDLLIAGRDKYGYRFRVYKNLGNGTFDPAYIEPEPGSTDQVLSIGWADYDNDGDLDIGMMCGTSYLRVYKNRGDGTFDPAEVDPDAAGVGVAEGGALDWGDYDNNGDLDLLALSNEGGLRMRVYRNNGDGTFNTNGIEPEPGWGVKNGNVKWGDYDADGDLDIAVIGEDNSSVRYFRIYKNNGDGTFDPNEIEPEPGWGVIGASLAWGDFDNDGDLDLMVGGSSNEERLRVYKSRVSDLSGPNTPPLPPGNINARFSYSVSRATITFTWSPSTYDTGHSSYSLYYQIAVASSPMTLSPDSLRVQSNSTLIISGNCSSSMKGNFVRPPVRQWPGDTEEKHGLVYSESLSNFVANTTYYYRLQTIDAGFARSTWSDENSIYVQGNNAPRILDCTQRTGTGAYPASFGWTSESTIISSFTVTDIDNNSVRFHVQITSVSNSGTPQWDSGLVIDYISELVAPGNKEYTWPALTDRGVYYWRVWAEDEYGACSSTVTLLSSGGTTALSWKTMFNPQKTVIEPGWGVNGAGGALISAGDMDGDGDYDLSLTGNASGLVKTFRVYRNDGGTFNPAEISPEPGWAPNEQQPCVGWYDMDNDGDLDLIVNGPPLRIYKNNGNGTFDSNETEPEPGWGLAHGAVTVNDLDNDGDLDIAVAGKSMTYYGARVFRVYRNNGDGTFDSNEIEPEPGWGVEKASLVAADFDADGDLDLAVSGVDGNGSCLRIYRNNGDASFDPNEISLLPGWDVAVGPLSCADYDNDGDLDIATTGFAGSSRFCLNVYRNKGDGTFDAVPITLKAGWGVESSGRPFWGDFDNDGDLDLLISGRSSENTNCCGIFLNNGDGTFDPSMIDIEPKEGISSGSSIGLDYDNDSDIDVVVVGQSNNSEYNLHLYTNMEAEMGNTNTPPSVPGSAKAWFDGAKADRSFTFKWMPGQYDAERSSHTVYYQIAVSTSPMVVTNGGHTISSPAKFTLSWNTGTELHNSIRPQLRQWSRGEPIMRGIVLKEGPLRPELQLHTTYYYRIQTIDAGLQRSAWSNEFTIYTYPPTSALFYAQ
jgi:hypothetical protein